MSGNNGQLVVQNAVGVHSTSAEDTVLSIMMRENEVIADVCRILVASHFYAHHRQVIFQAIVDLEADGKVADMVAVGELLVRRGELKELGADQAGSVDCLAAIWTNVSSMANVEHYARIVRGHAIQRQLFRTALETAKTAQHPTADPRRLVEEAEKRIAEIGEGETSSCVATFRQCLNETFDWIDRRQMAQGKDGVLSGFLDLDAKTGGFHNSEVTLIAARPSVGKTALACAIARNVADAMRPVFFVSLEQSRTELTFRLLCSESRINGAWARTGAIPADAKDRLIESRDYMDGFRLFIDDTPCQSIMRIMSQARRLKKKEDIRLVVIDYLQLIDMESEEKKGRNREQEISSVSRRIKLMARQLRIPVIALAQLNRQSESRAEGRPKLSDLRDSGSLEQDADTVLMLWRPEGRDSGIVEIEVAKQRNGPVGPVKLVFLSQYTRFENHAVEYPR